VAQLAHSSARLTHNVVSRDPTTNQHTWIPHDPRCQNAHALYISSPESVVVRVPFRMTQSVMSRLRYAFTRFLNKNSSLDVFGRQSSVLQKRSLVYSMAMLLWDKPLDQHIPMFLTKDNSPLRRALAHSTITSIEMSPCTPSTTSQQDYKSTNHGDFQRKRKRHPAAMQIWFETLSNAMQSSDAAYTPIDRPISSTRRRKKRPRRNALDLSKHTSLCCRPNLDESDSGNDGSSLDSLSQHTTEFFMTNELESISLEDKATVPREDTMLTLGHGSS
jgi:hypothetical protein